MFHDQPLEPYNTLNILMTPSDVKYRISFVLFIDCPDKSRSTTSQYIILTEKNSRAWNVWFFPYLNSEASERVSRYSHMITWFKSVSDLLDVKLELAR